MKRRASRSPWPGYGRGDVSLYKPRKDMKTKHVESREVVITKPKGHPDYAFEEADLLEANQEFLRRAIRTRDLDLFSVAQDVLDHPFTSVDELEEALETGERDVPPATARTRRIVRQARKTREDVEREQPKIAKQSRKARESKV